MMLQVRNLIRRNTKLFFKDKGMFLTSLITPLILLVLYTTFLGKVYRDSFQSALPEAFFVSDKVINGMVTGELMSSLLAVCCITVAFCSNMIMVQDKVTGARADLSMAPVKGSVFAISYYAATVLITLLICMVTTGVCFLYLAKSGWFLSGADVLGILADVVLLVLFGTALSSVINFFLTSQGQISGVGTVVSAGYGFICGAYMPISSFSPGLQKVISFLPGTYGTSLIRNHCMDGVFREMGKTGFPSQVVEAIKDSVDCNLYFYGKQVSLGSMYLVLIGAIVILVGLYVLMNVLRTRKGLA